MLGIGYKFYDKFGNFDNKKFLKLLEKARKEKLKGSKKAKGKLGSQEISLFNHVSKKEVWKFINKLTIFVNSGVDVKGALGILVKQIKNPYFKKIILEMKNNIDHGISVSETMYRYPKVFDELTVALIGVGEKTGLLGQILQELDKSMLENIELKGRIRSALIYPAVMVFLTITMLVFMMVFIVPRITTAFESSGVSLPWMTVQVINVSEFLINDWGKIIIGIIVLIITIKLIKKTYKGRMLFAEMALKAPVFGYIIKMSNIVYFINSFTILLNSGVLLLESLKTASKVVPNLSYKKEVMRIKNEVEFGLTISKALGLSLDYEESVYLNPYFPEDFAYVVNTGEETGSIADSMKKLGTNYEIDLKRYIGNLATLMEPMIIVFVGSMVGTIVIAIMLPFFELGKVVQNM